LQLFGNKGTSELVEKIAKDSDEGTKVIKNSIEEVSNPVESGGRKFWTEKIEHKGTKVYQRNDIIDPSKADKMGRTNIERMEQGLAPLGSDGKSVNLHHMTQTNDSAIAEVTQTFHQQNKRVIHINPNTIPSGIDRNTFNSWRKSYWKNRANEFK
ncbi:HNH/ENDO VII family nuclease, partial [Clostridium sp.]|uniref:HNH/ENDO VII family nuclease n=1 Tax=Clostridium sp. TaxID=1506 RepID=UPI002636343A